MIPSLCLVGCASMSSDYYHVRSSTQQWLQVLIPGKIISNVTQANTAYVVFLCCENVGFGIVQLIWMQNKQANEWMATTENSLLLHTRIIDVHILVTITGWCISMVRVKAFCVWNSQFIWKWKHSYYILHPTSKFISSEHTQTQITRQASV